MQAKRLSVTIYPHLCSRLERAAAALGTRTNVINAAIAMFCELPAAEQVRQATKARTTRHRAG